MCSDAITFLKEAGKIGIPNSDILELINNYLCSRTPEVFDIDPSIFKHDVNVLKNDDLVGYVIINKTKKILSIAVYNSQTLEKFKNETEDEFYLVHVHEIYPSLYN